MNGIGKKITKLTDVYFSEYSREAKAGALKFNTEHSYFVFGLVEKIVENLAAIGSLMELSEKEGMSFLRNSIYILLRSSMADAIILIWLFDNKDASVRDDESIKDKVHEMKRDHIRFYVSYLQKMQSLGLLPSSERDYEIEIINSRYRHLITEEINSNLSNKAILRSTPLADMLNAESKDNPVMVNAYRCYSILSKIEHTGEFTRMILEKSYQKENNPMDSHTENAIHIIECVIKVYSPIFLKNKEYETKINSMHLFE